MENSFSGQDSIFARRLRGLMEENRTTQKELAEVVGTTRQAISQYMDGSVQPNIEKLCKIASYYGCVSDYLLGMCDFRNTEEREKLEEVENYIIQKTNELPHKERGSLITALGAFIDADYRASTGGDTENEYVSLYAKKMSRIISEYAILINRSIYAKHGAFFYFDFENDTSSYLIQSIDELKKHTEEIGSLNQALTDELFKAALERIIANSKAEQAIW